MKLLSILCLFLVFAFWFPRFLIENLGKTNPWTSYFYHYGFGLLYTGSGLWLVLKTKACNLSLSRDRFWFGLTIMGFLYFAGLHAFWIHKALSVPLYEDLQVEQMKPSGIKKRL